MTGWIMENKKCEVKNFLKKKKSGAFSMMALVAILIAITVATGFISIMFKTMTQNEVKGIMDNAGILALRHGVDEDLWRREILYIDKAEAEAEFRRIIASNIGKGEGKLLKDYTISYVRVHEPNSPALKQLGIDGSQRAQYYIESQIVATYRNSTGISDSSSGMLDYFNIFNNRNESSGVTTGDGKITIRSVTRLVLR